VARVAELQCALLLTSSYLSATIIAIAGRNRRIGREGLGGAVNRCCRALSGRADRLREEERHCRFCLPLNGGVLVVPYAFTRVYVYSDDIGLRWCFGANFVNDTARPGRDNSHRKAASSSAVRAKRPAGRERAAKAAAVVVRRQDAADYPGLGAQASQTGRSETKDRASRGAHRAAALCAAALAL
jgi:hypothetical protein